MSYARTLAIDLPPGQSAFLWGARQTGKSTWLRERFPDSHQIDMLDFDTALEMQARPSRLGERLDALPPELLARPIVIDEVQKAPGLLDEVHRLIEGRRLSFILCGSSARKLRRSGVNLLGGRAWRLEIIAARNYQEKDFPIEFWRTKSGLEVDFVLNRGEVAIEAKSRVRSQDLRPMRAFVEEHSPRHAIVVNAANDRRRVDGIEIMPHPEFLELLHAGEFV